MESVEPVATAPASNGSAADIPEVQRILAARCGSCHGAEKQKGKFRVDRKESLLKGGDSGVPAVVPGDPAKSQLVRLILLPRGHDDVMPPDGKEPMTDAEILAVLKWIQTGAN
jgi:mono/diheme cytochrome c family protein